MPKLALLVASSVIAVLISVIRWNAKKRLRGDGISLPPGPKKLPIIGNLLVAPTEYQWVKYAQWAEEFGTDVLHLDVLGTSIIVLSSLESVQEILNRRSALTSSRPVSTIVNKLMGWEWNIVFKQYGEAWRIRRRMFWQEFHPSNSFNHQGSQLKHARLFLRSLLKEPERYPHHCRYSPASSIIEATYGVTVQPEDDPLIVLTDEVLHRLNDAAIPGTFLVDNIPILRYLPRWFPGAGFLDYAQIVYTNTMKMIDLPYEQSRTRILQEEGEAPPSSITRAYARDETVLEDAEKQLILKEVASSAYAGGADTTPPPLINFMARWLCTLKLPTFEDQAVLPYTHAVMWEILRWKPVIPLLNPHLSTSSDTYRGYFLPEGSVIFANVWAIFRDESLFPNPDEFRPERFITPDGDLDMKLADIVDMSFGFGRRICPGRFYAKDTLWMWMTSTLSVFNIRKAKDDNGNEIIPDLQVQPSFITFSSHSHRELN
ncbi:hypothetical protein ONZ45_g9144 [Pleurotus djamor]|nr:hypothetical protein ONZ45_g9144 [Pleurotus djamor]